MPEQDRPRLAVTLDQVDVQRQIRHERLPVIVIADQGREGMIPHQLDGVVQVITLELCGNVHGERRLARASHFS
jgi:hypothetical protein